MTVLSLLSRLACSQDCMLLYARIRQIPLIGEFSHSLVSRVLPRGAQVTVPVQHGLAAGLQVTIDPRFEADYVAGFYEPALQKCLAASLGRGQVFYDIGAHIGFITLVGARLVGPGGRVFAFEADPVNASRISHHAELNSLSQIELVRSAVWSECKSLSFQRDSESSSGNRGSVVDDSQSGTLPNIVHVTATTVDAFALEHPPPAVIKIDVEGAETEVMMGADRVLRESRPIVICEIHNADAADFVSRWLIDRGYAWEDLEKTNSFPRHITARPSSHRS